MPATGIRAAVASRMRSEDLQPTRPRTISTSCSGSTGLLRYPSGGGTCRRVEMNCLKSSETPVMMMTGIALYPSSSLSFL